MRILSLVVFIITIFVFLPIIILLLKDRLFRKKQSPEALASELHEYKMRLLNPDFLGMEQMLAAPLPQEVMSIYKSSLILETNIEVTAPSDPENPWLLSSFIPAQPIEYDDI